jgi:glycosyltransferase involved in cell wall biosynthesis
MASGFQRKNPIASVRAFKQAFGTDPTARMIVKVVNPDHYPEGMAALAAAVNDADNISIVVSVMPRRQVMELIAESDAVLSLHRSEGFGMLAAEAMLIGTPVVATDWSATAEFVRADTGMPIPYGLIPAIDPQGCSHDPEQNWADANVTAAADALVKLRSEPEFASRLAVRARQTATLLFSQDRYAGLIKDALGPDATLH